MDAENAIKTLENEVTCVRRETCERSRCVSCDLVLPVEQVLAAYEMAISALRKVAEIDQVKPLALEELREMGGDPVWLECDTGDGECGYWCLCDKGLIVMPTGLTMDCRDVPDWKLYRRKPAKEEKRK